MEKNENFLSYLQWISPSLFSGYSGKGKGEFKRIVMDYKNREHYSDMMK